MDLEETTRILKHLVEIGRPPPYFNPATFKLIISISHFSFYMGKLYFQKVRVGASLTF